MVTKIVCIATFIQFLNDRGVNKLTFSFLGEVSVSVCAVKRYVCTVAKTGQLGDKASHRPVSFISVPLMESFRQEHGYRI